jgi:hypothetical protein
MVEGRDGKERKNGSNGESALSDGGDEHTAGAFDKL